MGRVKYAVKNIFFGYISNVAIMILGFILRTIFIYKLGETLLGVNGLFTNILSALSLADLGLGIAMNYSLYAPVAQKDYNKIKALMSMYKRAYRIIACIVTALGLLLLPFLKYIIKEPGAIEIGQLQTYYLIFLFNIVSTYFVSYKYSLVNAEQKNYIQTNITTLTRIATVTLQIVFLLIFENFLFYLLIQLVVELIQKIIVNFYLNKRYPYLREKSTEVVSQEDKQPIINNVKALLLHKIGDVARFQTDSIIISAFINVTTVGLIDNYNLIITSVSGFVNIIFNSVITSFGNLIATEGKDKQFEVFQVYRFLGAWIYGFSAVGYIILISPLVSILWGEKMVIGGWAIYLIIFDYYFKGFRIVLTNFKTAAGIFEADKYIALIQGIVNLIISIVLVKKIGLAGVYVGTVISGIIANFTKPYLIYKLCFEKSVLQYYKDSVKYILTAGMALFISLFIKQVFLLQNNLVTFVIMFMIITVVYNVIYLICFGKGKEFKYLVSIVRHKFEGRGN